MDARRSPFSAIRCWLRCHPYSGAGTLALLGILGPFLFRTDPEWENVFIGAARHLRGGEDLYRAAEGYLYPPFMAWILVPLSHLPVVPGRAVWCLVNAVCLVAMFRGAWRLAGGGRLEPVSASLRREHLAALLGAAGALVYVENCLAHRQTDVVMGTLLIGGCLALQRARGFAAATLFGLAAAMKCTPLLWAPYLAWRGRPGAAAWLVAVALGVNALPDGTHPAPSGRPWLVEYATRHLKPLTERDHVVGAWASDIIYNQSLAGACNRWLLTHWNWEPGDCRVEPRPSPISPVALRGLVLSIEMALLGAALFLCGRPFRPVADGNEDQAPLEYSLILLLMLLLSPMSSKAHFGLLVLPGFVLARAVFRDGSRAAGLACLGALLMTLLACKDPLGNRVYTLCLWYGSVTWHTLFLTVGCMTLLVTRRATIPAATAEYGDALAASSEPPVLQSGMRNLPQPLWTPPLLGSRRSPRRNATPSRREPQPVPQRLPRRRLEAR